MGQGNAYFREPYDPKKEYITGGLMLFSTGVRGVIAVIERIGPDKSGKSWVTGYYKGEKP